VLSIAFNDRCDVIVATIAAGGDEPAAQEEAALEFLNGDLVLHWAQTTLGLNSSGPSGSGRRSVATHPRQQSIWFCELFCSDSGRTKNVR
jgi:hypothetical protein